jgi:hypothetical protein
MLSFVRWCQASDIAVSNAEPLVATDPPKSAGEIGAPGDAGGAARSSLQNMEICAATIATPGAG